MNTNVTLGAKEKKILERVAWGASYKEVASFFKISVNTVDNTLRHIKTKIGLSKVGELSAWWFCTNYGISFDLSPLQRQILAFGMVLLLISTEINFIPNQVYVRRNRRSRIEVRLPVRARIVETSSS